MTMTNLTSFFNYSFETEINEYLQILNVTFPIEKVLDYVHLLINTPIEEFLNWLKSHSFFTLESKDMPQLSKFEDAFYNVVHKMIANGDKGFRFVEIGEMLQSDGKQRKDGANRKYGENHAKAAEYLGYLYTKKFYYFVSCYGYIESYLSEEEKIALFIRLLIRTNLFKAVYFSYLNGKVELRYIFDFLSDKTYIRRVHSTRQILNVLKLCKDFSFDDILNKIVY